MEYMQLSPLDSFSREDLEISIEFLGNEVMKVPYSAVFVHVKFLISACTFNANIILIILFL